MPTELFKLIPYYQGGGVDLSGVLKITYFPGNNTDPDATFTKETFFEQSARFFRGLIIDRNAIITGGLFSGTIESEGDIITEKGSIIIEGNGSKFMAQELRGTGNAYACINSNGQIYRSLNATCR